jgi:hypothetical protein
VQGSPLSSEFRRGNTQFENSLKFSLSQYGHHVVEREVERFAGKGKVPLLAARSDESGQGVKPGSPSGKGPGNVTYKRYTSREFR